MRRADRCSASSTRAPGAEQLDWKPTRSAEVEYQNEIDDLEQMTEAVNARRRARGGRGADRGGVRAEVAEERAAPDRERDGGEVEQDIDEMLEIKNARRARARACRR